MLNLMLVSQLARLFPLSAQIVVKQRTRAEYSGKCRFMMMCGGGCGVFSVVGGCWRLGVGLGWLMGCKFEVGLGWMGIAEWMLV